MAAHKNDCLVGLIAAFALKHYRDILTTDVLGLPDWQADFAQSRLGDTAPQVPILQYHGLIDEVIPYSLGEHLRNQWCASGVTVEFDTYPADHVTGVIEGAPAAMVWLNARIAGAPPPNNCSSTGNPLGVGGGGCQQVASSCFYRVRANPVERLRGFSGRCSSFIGLGPGVERNP